MPHSQLLPAKNVIASAFLRGQRRGGGDGGGREKKGEK